MNKIKYVIAACLVAAVAYAATDLNVSKVNDPRPQQFTAGIYIGPTATIGNKITKQLGASAVIDFAAASEGQLQSSAITVTGAKAGDPCSVGSPTAAGALAAQFSCYVSAADTVKIVFEPMSVQKGTAALSSGTPSQTTVSSITAGSDCSCSPVGATSAIAAAGCAASLTSTTLTLTGPTSVTTTMSYRCVAPVDPASGTYFVRVLSSQ